MNILKVCLLFVFGVLLTGTANAQLNDPTSWNYEVKKLTVHEYELVFHLSLEDKWHIWSLHPGGDGFELAPTFKINSDSKVKLLGNVTERGTPITTAMEGIDGKVTFFKSKVDYVQKIMVDGPAKITGEHEYQVCNDNMCLPPKTKKFSFEIKN